MLPAPETRLKFSSRCDAGGFSLLELIVAIAVLAILATTLIVSTSRVREGFQNAHCVSNLRQLHVATMQWIEASDRRMPDRRIWTYDNLENNPQFQYQIAAYLSLGRMQTTTAGEPLRTVMTCPTANTLRKSTQPWLRTYSINAHATASSDGQPLNAQWYPQSITDISHPSEMVLYMDGAVSTVSGGGYWTNAQYNQVDPSVHATPLQYPHGDALNAVFIDGHVQRISREQMIADNSQGMIRFWRYNAP